MQMSISYIELRQFWKKTQSYVRVRLQLNAILGKCDINLRSWVGGAVLVLGVSTKHEVFQMLKKGKIDQTGQMTIFYIK